MFPLFQLFVDAHELTVTNTPSKHEHLHPGSVDYPALLKIGRDLLIALGEDPDREGLHDTPRRFADAWREFIAYNAGTTDTTFSSFQTGQLVVVKGMRVYSFCEHHLLPFWCDISIGYLTGDKVLGLSKFARIAHKHAHKLQLQERLCSDIASELIETIGSPDVIVICSGEHSCMTTRGIKTPGIMTSTSMSGAFETDRSLRMEFLHLVGNQ